MERAHTVDNDLWGLLTRLRELVEEAAGEGQTTGDGAEGVATNGEDDQDAPEEPISTRA